MTRAGPSGLVLVPTGQVVKSSQIALGIHRGIVKLAYGLLGIIETGVSSPDLYDDPNLAEWKGDSIWFVKFGGSPAPRRWWVPGMAAGAENSPVESRETYYATATWHRPVAGWPVEVTGGAGTGRFSRSGTGTDLGVFAAVGVIPRGLLGNTVKIVGELAGDEADVGLRLALSRNLRLDFVVLMKVEAPSDGEGNAWKLSVTRGLPGASMVTDLGSLVRMILPTRKGAGKR